MVVSYVYRTVTHSKCGKICTCIAVTRFIVVLLVMLFMVNTVTVMLIYLTNSFGLMLKG